MISEAPFVERAGRHAARSVGDLGALVAEHGAPLVVLDPNQARIRYRELESALPFVRFHYDVSALVHPAIVGVIADCDGYFEVGSGAEIATLKQAGVDPGRAMYSHPLIQAQDALAAYCAGIRLFVVQDESEVARFIDYPGAQRLVVRLAFDGTDARAKDRAAVDPGLTPEQAAALVRFANRVGVRIAGFSVQLGPGAGRAQPYAAAIARTLGLMTELETELGCRFELIDICGGLQPSDSPSAADFAEVVRAIRTLLLPVAERITVMAQPANSIAADCFTFVTETDAIAMRARSLNETLDSGVSVIVVDGQPPQQTFFRALADSRHRIFRSPGRGMGAQTRAG
jgi:ornithine decarboxylase